jgi:hypothetical protein
MTGRLPDRAGRPRGCGAASADRPRENGNRVFAMLRRPEAAVVTERRWFYRPSPSFDTKTDENGGERPTRR